MATLPAIGRTIQALADMQRSAQEAAGALREVCVVLDDIAIDKTFARHADRAPLRQASDRIENVARTLIGEARASGPIGAKHASIIGKVALAAATMSVLPFAEDAGHIPMQRFKAAHERAMRSLEWVGRYADCVQSETRQDLRLQIAALSAELGRLAIGSGMAATHAPGELEQAIRRRELPASWTLEHLDDVLVAASCAHAERGVVGEGRDPIASPPEDRLARLAEIEFEIAEIFAQLTGDDPL